VKLYKLTDANDRTNGGWNSMTARVLQWGENITHTAKGKGTKLCSEDVIHAYTSPLLAMLMNPIHADIANPHLWEAKGNVVAKDGTKVGCKRLTTIRRLDPPTVTTEQRIRFAILCAKKVYTDPKWIDWANKWLSGEDRIAYVVASIAATNKIDLNAIAREAMKTENKEPKP
jgi:hypothetical protein